MDNWLSHISVDDDPNYYAKNLKHALITSSRPSRFSVGTGSQIMSSVLSQCVGANHEIVIVTCFWARSKSQQDVAKLLRHLSEKAQSRANDRKIRVRLCFSSTSIFQKAFQTANVDGKDYPPATWNSIGLPAPEEIPGVELVIKSVFVRPFSVMHPKFIIVDRKRVFLPSCNVSWEDWFEGCIDMEGEIVRRLLDFWIAFWNRGVKPPTLPDSSYEPTDVDEYSQTIGVKMLSLTDDIQTILLPSPHHQNPRFSPFASSVPPATPLNIYLLHTLKSARASSSIYIQTPNLTSRPFIDAIFSALQNGVNVQVVTSKRLMILEQLVTAGTTTELEIWKLRRRYSKLSTRTDPEAGLLPVGTLKVGYFKPRTNDAGEPVKSHLKCLIVDEEITILGSGNMDRASWYTSQELGVAFVSTEVAKGENYLPLTSLSQIRWQV
ncbi:hypothetical protein BJ878DRAFT_83487 [Calycina marina]|uniref:PLD phosphodiesterase domain-containing protein n=1 Tax=Calycina marina TaxID=1763456 RepID=A0A9P8CK26_9HELO|nr:hypothetical protein BJ878DRAFT_83487 [Calycina marina]